MNIDFHYGVIYAVARIAGLPCDQAEIVAHACQYVDDATTDGLLQFDGGEIYERFASAHSMLDYRNAEDVLNRAVWVPFHFVPAAKGDTLEERAVCRPDNEIAREAVRWAIHNATAENELHRLGVSLHAYVDTWAHQGFSGIESPFNRVHHLQADDCTARQWMEKLRSVAEEALNGAVEDVISSVAPVGHAAALHYPDAPWAKWHYVNGRGETIHRDNITDFVSAADMACRAIRGFIAHEPAFERAEGLPQTTRLAIAAQLATNRDDDAKVRLDKLRDAIRAGNIPGVDEPPPPYIAKGAGSWKHRATQIADDHDGPVRPKHTEAFERSDYRHFHDATKEHRFTVTQEILPRHGLRIA